MTEIEEKKSISAASETDQLVQAGVVTAAALAAAPGNTLATATATALLAEDIVTNQTSAPEQAKLPKRHQTGGEKLFDRVVYTGIGFGVNEASSLWITSQFLYGKNLLKSAPDFLKKAGNWFSKDGYDKIAKKLADTFNVKGYWDKNANKFITGPKKAGNLMLMVTLLSGGTLLILPMRWLENSKSYWVKKANHWLDNRRGHQMSQEEVGARDKEVEQHIACSPKQSWGSLLLGRLVACSASVSTGTFLVKSHRNDKLSNISENLFTGGGGVKEEKSIMRGIAALTLVETYSCAISSIVLEVASKFFARSKPKPRNRELCVPEGAVVASATAPISDTDSNGSIKKIASQAPKANHVERVAAEPAGAAQVGL